MSIRRLASRLVLAASLSTPLTGLAAPRAVAAAPPASPAVTSPAATAPSAPIVPSNYADPANWLLLPTSTPRSVDVFWISPTTCFKQVASHYCAVNDPAMVAGAGVLFRRDGAAFEPYANVFAPNYRQVDGLWQLFAQTPAQQDVNIQQEPLADVQAAFDWYLTHLNHGRPFIPAAHSQGAHVMTYLLAGYVAARPQVRARMIAAYAVGTTITTQFLAANRWLPFARGRNDTGVIVSWNTEAPALTAPSPITRPGGVAINPISWTRTERLARAERNLGSVSLDPATGLPVVDAGGRLVRVRGLADARVDLARGVVVASTPDPAAWSPSASGVFHSYDYAFYFFDIRANGQDRIDAWWRQHHWKHADR